MSNHESNRVLSRVGARTLTMEETGQVSGGQQILTDVCTAMRTTAAHPRDGDGCSADNDNHI